MLQQRSCGISNMPLLMGFTSRTPIMEGGINSRFTYDSIMQITEYDMATIGTKSLKCHTTSKGPGKGQTMDRKNEIDDSKTK